MKTEPYRRVLESFRRLPEILGSRLQGIQARALAGAREEPKAWISEHLGHHLGDLFGDLLGSIFELVLGSSGGHMALFTGTLRGGV